MKIGFLKILIVVFVVLVGYQCQDNDPNKLRSSFEINGQIVNNTKNFEKIYLGYELQNGFYLLDSAEIRDEKFRFKGKIAYPQKAQLVFYEFAQPFHFILTGEQIEVQIDANSITHSKYANSPINDEFQSLKYQSVAINNSIDYLYPTLQKARLENDYDALEKVISEIKKIEHQNNTFILNYIHKNPKTLLSALLLNDLYTSGTTDTLILKQTAQHIQPELKKALYFEP